MAFPLSYFFQILCSTLYFLKKRFIACKGLDNVKLYRVTIKEMDTFNVVLKRNLHGFVVHVLKFI